MSALQDDLDALQVKHLGPRPTQAQVAEYFNRCLNSACGAVEAHSRGGNRAVRASLEIWRMLVDERCELESATPRGLRMIDESARNRVFAEHRFGRIEVTIDAMRGQPAEMMRVLSDMLVLRAETLIFRNVIAYEVACAELDPVPEGSELPLYHVIVHTKAGKFSHRTFEKVKA